MTYASVAALGGGHGDDSNMSEADIPLRGATLSRLAPVAEAQRTTPSPVLTPADSAALSVWSATWLWQRAFSFPAMLGVFLIGRVFYEARAFMVDPDLWWHVRIGQDIFATHHWPIVDPYSFTVGGNPWIAYEWLGDVLIGAVERAGGLL